MLKSLRRRQSWTNILHWSSKFSWTLAFENTWHLTREFFVRFISEDSAKYKFIQLWWEPLSRILAPWKHTHFHTYTKIQLCLDFSADKVTLSRFLLSYFNSNMSTYRLSLNPRCPKGCCNTMKVRGEVKRGEEEIQREGGGARGDKRDLCFWAENKTRGG